jgi:RimJ/RimL family protein N-acetyltransferase
MRLLPVHFVADAATWLYALLLDREPSQNISHRGMPTVEQHLAFVRSNPYEEWNLVEVVDSIVGATYLTRAGEIGIFIFKAYRGHGYGKRAVQMMMEKHKDKRLLANINPANEASIGMFQKLGFNLIQHTYERMDHA